MKLLETYNWQYEADIKKVLIFLYFYFITMQWLQENVIKKTTNQF
jgi:hypothetical protein